MKTTTRQGYVPHAGDHLRGLVKMASYGGLFFSLSGTMLIWSGTDSFHCPAVIWKASLMFNLFALALTWLFYLPFRNTDQLLGNGVLTLFVLFSLFWMFGFSTFYFYFLFAPLNLWLRSMALVGVTTMIIYRAHVIMKDIQKAFRNHKTLFGKMYCDDGISITFRRDAIGQLEKSRKDRNPFKSFHAYAAVFLSPFVLVLNRLLTPVFGDGHGVFIVSSFFAVPILLWGVELVVQTVITMIYYPLKLQKETGKPVLMKDW